MQTEKNVSQYLSSNSKKTKHLHLPIRVASNEINIKKLPLKVEAAIKFKKKLITNDSL
ncbi:hypothetical protein B4102_3072 [Heyndrickxia sporothermodurans]|uniref:Uncharacterized protein n=1 Tax=Heyndrickxia sporothermodurans TaxID=46224 RepID=A0A150L1D0_9BACI|nr:hypothetical protein B4102_3072 [Heyndrickxia sporothermodurans]